MISQNLSFPPSEPIRSSKDSLLLKSVKDQVLLNWLLEDVSNNKEENAIVPTKPKSPSALSDDVQTKLSVKTINDPSPASSPCQSSEQLVQLPTAISHAERKLVPLPVHYGTANNLRVSVGFDPTVNSFIYSPESLLSSATFSLSDPQHSPGIPNGDRIFASLNVKDSNGSLELLPSLRFRILLEGGDIILSNPPPLSFCQGNDPEHSSNLSFTNENRPLRSEDSNDKISSLVILNDKRVVREPDSSNVTRNELDSHCAASLDSEKRCSNYMSDSLLVPTAVQKFPKTVKSIRDDFFLDQEEPVGVTKKDEKHRDLNKNSVTSSHNNIPSIAADLYSLNFDDDDRSNNGSKFENTARALSLPSFCRYLSSRQASIMFNESLQSDGSSQISKSAFIGGDSNFSEIPHNQRSSNPNFTFNFIISTKAKSKKKLYLSLDKTRIFKAVSADNGKSNTENEFYHTVFQGSEFDATSLQMFVPRYYGCFEDRLDSLQSRSSFISLENILYGFDSYSFMDLKMAPQKWEESASYDVIVKKKKKWAILLEEGIQIEGVRTGCTPSSDGSLLDCSWFSHLYKLHGYQSFVMAFNSFFDSARVPLEPIVNFLGYLQSLFRFFQQQHLYRFYCTSLFLVFGMRHGRPAFRCCMIDFEHVTRIRDVMGIDSGYIFAVAKLLTVIRQVLQFRSHHENEKMSDGKRLSQSYVNSPRRSTSNSMTIDPTNCEGSPIHENYVTRQFRSGRKSSELSPIQKNRKSLSTQYQLQ